MRARPGAGGESQAPARSPSGRPSTKCPNRASWGRSRSLPPGPGQTPARSGAARQAVLAGPDRSPVQPPHSQTAAARRTPPAQWNKAMICRLPAPVIPAAAPPPSAYSPASQPNWPCCHPFRCTPSASCSEYRVGQCVWRKGSRCPALSERSGKDETPI